MERRGRGLARRVRPPRPGRLRSAAADVAAPSDDLLPVRPLLGPDARALLAPAVAGSGGTIDALRPRFVNYRPGRRIAVRYRAHVRWPDGRATEETLVASARAARPEPAVWRWPDDPLLPGARPATDPDFVRGLLADPSAAPAGPLGLTVRSYWPGRRAVLQATVPGRDERVLFVKVVRPRAAERLRRLHDKLAEHLPVARCLGSSAQHGILVLEALPGQTISACLADAGSAPPPPSDLLGVLHELGSVPGLDRDAPRRTTAEKVASHVRLLRHLLPDEAPALERFAERYGEDRPQPPAIVHGDFHEEQVLARDGRVSGLLDVDDVGPGQLVDDLALMVARVRARASYGRRGRDRASDYERRLVEAFGTAVDPGELRRRAAGAMLGRATAPFRVQSPDWRATSSARIRLAEAELERCARAAA